MAECSHDCSECEKRKNRDCKGEADFRVKANAKSNIRRVVAVMSGKGGVGKSMVTSLLGLPKPPKPDDTADALAIALCHGQNAGSRLQGYFNGR